MSCRRFLLILLAVLTFGAPVLAAAVWEAPGAEAAIPLSTRMEPLPKTPWYTAIRSRHYSTRDTNVTYPRFLRLALELYNWGDTFFNSFNPDYVKGTGKKWKVLLTLNNWTDSYAMRFHERTPVRMLSDPTADIGLSVSYMALSLGYSVNLNNVISHSLIARNRFVAQFTCGRFSADFYYWDNDGGTIIRRFGDYDGGRLLREKFGGLRLHCTGGHLYYFLNNKKYSQGAAYNFSKLQQRSAGSFIFGVNISRQDIDIDFNGLPDEMKEFLNTPRMNYTFDYNDYSVIVGYGHNICLGRHFLFNVSALPSFGIKHSRRTSVEGRRDFFAVNIQGKLAFVYNLRNYFVGLNGNFDGHWYKNRRYSFFNSLENLTLQTGFRF